MKVPHPGVVVLAQTRYGDRMWFFWLNPTKDRWENLEVKGTHYQPEEFEESWRIRYIYNPEEVEVEEDLNYDPRAESKETERMPAIENYNLDWD